MEKKDPKNDEIQIHIEECKPKGDLYKELCRPSLRLHMVFHPKSKKGFILKEVKREAFASSAVAIMKQSMDHLVGLKKLARNEPSAPILHMADYTTDVKYMYYLYNDCPDGVLLSSQISKRKSRNASSDELRGMMKSLLGSLWVYHKHNLAHGDLKPANVLLEHSTVARRLSLPLKGHIEENTNVVARITELFTPRYPSADCKWFFTALEDAAYVAPEILRSRGLNQRADVLSMSDAELRLGGDDGPTVKADIWSVGAIAYELSQGRPPFGITRDEVEQQVADGRYEIKGVTEQCADFIAQCLQADPDKRPTCAELLDHMFLISDAELFESIGEPGSETHVFNCNEYRAKPVPESASVPEEQGELELEQQLRAFSQSEPVAERASRRAPAKIRPQPPVMYYFAFPSKFHLLHLETRERAEYQSSAKISSYVGIVFAGRTLYFSGGYENNCYSRMFRGLEVDFPHGMVTKERVLKSMGTGRTAHKLLAIDDSTLLAIGGMNEGTGRKLQCLAVTERYDIARDEWSQGPMLNVARSLPGAIAMYGDSVYVFCGWNHAEGYLASIEVAGPDRWTLIKLVKGMPAVASPGAVQISQDEMLVFGGNTAEGEASSACFRVAVETENKPPTVTEAGRLAERDAFGASAQVLFWGKIWAVGWGRHSLHKYALDKKDWSAQNCKKWFPAAKKL